jgi:D-alanyl-D-alanine carboxypeptidase/D-alanyl-D-alanine-endopeptidase (penicillin-binding protein 4)
VKRPRRALIPALLALAALLVPRAAARAAGPPSLGRALDAILDRPALRAAFWGVEVRSLKTAKLLYARNEAKAFRPASTLKLVTTAAALDAFGPEARLRTSLETAARRDGAGRILGDVFLVGRGDPSLGGGRHGDGRPLRPFEDMAEALRAAGITRIEGRVVGHEGLFTGERRGNDWGWEDLVWSYGAEVSALSFNDNSVGLSLAPGEQAGDPAVLDAVPASRYYGVASTVTTAPAGARTELRLVRDAGTNQIRLSGVIAIGDAPWKGWVALEDPARFAATVLAEVLEARGVRVLGGVATSSAPLPGGRRELAGHDGPPLSELIKGINKESRNLHAEALLRLLGVRRGGEGSVEEGRRAVSEFLERQGVKTEAWGLEDGSGLSRSSVVTPAGLVQLLAAMDRHPHAAAFRESLPVAGRDGTLATRLKGTQAAGRVLAKTGTLALVNALAGYVTTPSGDRLAFAALANDHVEPVAALDALDALAETLATR